MSCGCSGGGSSGGAGGGPLLSTSLDSRFGAAPPVDAATVGADLMSLLSGPGGWIGIALFVVAAGAVLWASTKKSE